MAKAFQYATWAHSVSNFGSNQDEVRRHVERLNTAGFELIIPCVKNPPGYVDFRTEVAIVNPSYPGWDPLRVLAESADEHGMKVHPWFCIFPEGEGSKLLNQKPYLGAVFSPATCHGLAHVVRKCRSMSLPYIKAWLIGIPFTACILTTSAQGAFAVAITAKSRCLPEGLT